MARPLSVESPILALDQIGKPAIFDALSRAYVRDSRFPFVFFRYDHHAWVRSRCERNHEGICTGPSFDSIDEPGMICHDARQMDLDVIVDFNKQRVLSVFAPCEQLVFLFLKLVELFDGGSLSPFFGETC